MASATSGIESFTGPIVADPASLAADNNPTNLPLLIMGGVALILVLVLMRRKG